MTPGHMKKRDRRGSVLGSRLRASGLTSISIVASIALVLVAVWAGVAMGAAGDPVQPRLMNEGFEEGPIGQVPTYWISKPPAPGTVVAVGTELPSQFPVYTTMRIDKVEPQGGNQMLRLGVPKGTDKNQIKGVEKVEQTFVANGQPIVLAYRIFTWEHRSGDTFVIEWKSASSTSPSGTHPAPIPPVSKTTKYGYSAWTNFSITGLSIGETYTLSYTLSNTTNAAHDTWVYVDHPNVAPVMTSATITSSDAFNAYETSVLTASGAATDADGDTPTFRYEWFVNGSTTGQTGSTLDGAYFSKADVVTCEIRAYDGTAESAPLTSNSITIVNSAPAAGTVTITPDTASTEDTLTANPSGFTDPDGDDLAYSYVWYKNAAVISGVTGATLDLSVAGNGDKNDVMAVSVTASDGAATSGAATDNLTVSGSPPVAGFTWGPGGPGGEWPHEGDVVGLYSHLSSDPDGAEDIVKWEWSITKDGETEIYNQDNGFQSPFGFIVPYDEGHDAAAYEVTLTVFDKDGMSGKVTKPIDVQNYVPRVNALNIEVLSGGSAQLVGRFLDPGWTDNHTASWTPSPPSGALALPAAVEEDHAATVSSGYVGGIITAADAAGHPDWTLAVNDGDGGVGADSFKVAVIDPDQNRFEDQDTFPNVNALPGDGAFLSYIQSQADVDTFEVKTADGGPLPMGTEVLATLRNLPADYDLVVFETVEGTGATENAQAAPFMHSPFSTAPFMNSPFMNSPFMHSPFMNSPFMNSPFMHSPFMHSPFMNSPFADSPFMNSPFMNSPFMNSPFMHSPFMHSPFMNSPFMHSPFMHSKFASVIPAGWTDLDGYPLSSMSYTGTANDNTSGIDIAFNELGFDHESMQNLRVLGFSANTGTEPEMVLATAGYPQTDAIKGHVYVAVKSAAGSYSTVAPYTLQIETSRPFDALALEQQEQQPLVAQTQNWGPLPSPQNPETLFVTQLDRLEALYSGGGQVVKDALVNVAGRSDVRGKIISVPADLYTEWDKKPWLVDEANKVAQSIRSVIQGELADPANSSIEYVVLVGNDRIIPFKRLIDQAIIGNEQNYTNESFLTPPSATLSSIANGYILTDDYYVDQTPIGWSGSYLYIPDLAVSRLVETPGEIAGTIQAFIDADGVLAPAAAVVNGHSFMTDGAQVVRDILAGAGVTMLDPEPDPGVPARPLIGETWTGKNLWDGLKLGPNVTSLNSHFTHFAGLSAYGYGQSVAELPYEDSELLLSKDIAAAGGGSLFKGKLVFSMGCHAGLNVPDEQEVKFSPDDPIDPALDLPQALMRQGGIYLGSTGYGYGDTVGIAGTEALIGFFARELVGGTDPSTVGLAIARAKQAYLGSLSTLTPYEQKSSVEFTLYGMPQYHLPDLPAAAATAQAAITSSASLAAASSALGTFRLNLSERPMLGTTGSRSVVDQSYDLSLETGTTGQYITADGRSEATPDRPIHPVVPVDLPPRPDQGPAHGFVYKQGVYAELTPGPFNPAISRLTTEWEAGATEFQVATSDFWPVEPGVLTTIEKAPAEYDQTFVAVPAQFKPTANTSPISGTERVWSYLEAEVLRSTAPATGREDWLPPSVSDVDLWMDGGNLVVSVDAHDSSGISRMVVLQMDANGMYTPVGGDHDFGNPGTPNGDGERYEVNLNLAGLDPAAISLFIQVVDGSGNVTMLTGKGATVRVRQPWNLGFEDGLNYWNVTEPVAGNAVVVGEETFPELGIPQVRPNSLDFMLRLGEPKGTDSHQVKGVTAVSQQFISDGGDIVVAYRMITLDRRVYEDIFTIDVKDTSGTLMYSLRVPNEPYGVSPWTQVKITGLPAGKTFTLTYTLNNTISASHDTWVYVDQGD